VPAALSNYLNTKTGQHDPVHCKNYHVVAATGLVVLTARGATQKGYNPSLFYRALIHFFHKEITGCLRLFFESL
jgi:hypothetical protein